MFDEEDREELEQAQRRRYLDALLESLGSEALEAAIDACERLSAERSDELDDAA